MIQQILDEHVREQSGAYKLSYRKDHIMNKHTEDSCHDIRDRRNDHYNSKQFSESHIILF